MLRSTLQLSIALLIAGAAGCAASAEINPASRSADQWTPTQLAAWSATSKFPATQESTSAQRLPVTVIVNKDRNTIKVYNFTGAPIRDAKLWVNRTFVSKIDGIAPMSKAVVQTDRLYDSIGNQLSKQKVEISSVQLETPEGLFNLQGPATE